LKVGRLSENLKNVIRFVGDITEIVLQSEIEAQSVSCTTSNSGEEVFNLRKLASKISQAEFIGPSGCRAIATPMKRRSIKDPFYGNRNTQW